LTGPAKDSFVRGINLTSAISLVVGSMIGSGIFIVSADIGRQTGAAGLILVVWATTALVTVMGALTQTELVGMYPKAGGQYVFLREGLGPLWGFLYGWTLLLVIQTGTIAADPAAWGDVILARKDAPAGYHLAVVVDDAAQDVSNVVRGHDLFHATSVHRLLQVLLGYPQPGYHHHRLVLDDDGKKLSKSTSATGLRERRAGGAAARAVPASGVRPMARGGVCSTAPFDPVVTS